MGENSKIEWTHHTFNGWWGCTRVSPACDHCYAADLAKRYGEPNLWQGDRRRTSAQNWKQPRKWDREAAAAGVRRRVFAHSMSDVFDNAVDPAWRADLFRLIAETPNLDWLVLTKRIANAWPMMLDVSARCAGGTKPLPNVWLGATVANQEEADRDIPKLLGTPAAVRFLSIEPLLGPIDLQKLVAPGYAGATLNCLRGLTRLSRAIALRTNDRPRVDWVIVGGESGPGARPMAADWVRDIRDQCAEADVPFLFKQWGEWVPACQPIAQNFSDISPNGFSIRVGKKQAGRVLDGVTHDGYPSGATA